MEKKNYLTLNKQNQKDLTDYCKLNNIEDVDKFFQKCFKRGYDIERYGLIGNTSEPEKIIEYVEKEVPIKEVEKEVINTVYVEKEVPIEKIVEVIKEIPIYISGDTQIIEKIIEIPIEVIKEVEVVKEIDKPNEKMGMLQETLMKLRREMGDKDKTITELNNKIEQLEKLVSNTGAIYMKGSNLSQNL
jgi:predicted  nucleic acid-binding Zn-ribbon protein